MNGWIKLHRKLLEWEWYTDVNTSKLFLHLLLKANFESKSWQGINIERGQVVVGRKILSKETGLSEQEIRTSIIKLKSTSELTIKSTNKNSIITLINYSLYQSGEDECQPANQPATQPTINQQSTTTKEVKKEKKEKKEYICTPNELRLFYSSIEGDKPFNKEVGTVLTYMLDLGYKIVRTTESLNEHAKRCKEAAIRYIGITQNGDVPYKSFEEIAHRRYDRHLEKKDKITNYRSSLNIFLQPKTKNGNK